MMNAKFQWLSISLLFAVAACAEEQAGGSSHTPSLVASAASGQASTFTIENLSERFFDEYVFPNWIGNDGVFWYQYRDSEGARYVVVDPAANARTEASGPDDLAERIAALAGEAYVCDLNTPVALTPDEEAEMIAASRRDVDHLWKFPGRTPLPQMTCAPESQPPAIPIDSQMSEVSRSPNGEYVVFVNDYDLYVKDRAGAVRQLTDDGEEWRRWGLDRFSIYEGRQFPAYWFGAGSNKFYVQIWDWRNVNFAYTVDSLAKPRPTLTKWKDSYAGEPDENLQKHELWVFDAETGEKVQVDADKWPGQVIGQMDLGWRWQGPDSPYATGVYPSADHQRVYFSRMTRGYKNRELLVADAATGATRILLEESDPAHIDIRFTELGLVNDGEELVWLRERDGARHLDLLDEDGGFKAEITKGDFVVNRIVLVDSARREVWFSATGYVDGENKHNEHLLRIGLDGENLVDVTPDDASHYFDRRFISPNGEYIVDSFSRPDLPSRTVLRDRAGAVHMPLEVTDTSKLEEIGWRPPETFTLTAADGETDLYGVMWKPFNFDPDRSYPVIQIVYPGPGGLANIPIRFEMLSYPNGQARHMAELGFVVFMTENRGGARSRKREYATYGHGHHNHPRDFPLADIGHTMETLLARHSFLDPERTGVWGYSGGGYASALAILTHTDLYKVAVSGSGNHDTNIMEQNASEYHYGLINNSIHAGAADNDWPEYPTTADLAQNLKGKLLLIQGDHDRVVHPANTMRLIKALMDANKLFDMLILPNYNHNMLSMDPYAHNAAAAYFVEHLQGRDAVAADMDIKRFLHGDEQPH